MSKSASQPSNIAKSTSSPILPPWYYRVIIRIATPIYRLILWQRRKKSANTTSSSIYASSYADEISERFGSRYQKNFEHGKYGKHPIVWCHAVSLGETNTVAPMLDLLLQQGYHLWLTNTTHTGFARVQQRFAKAIEAGQVNHSYVPVDNPKVITKFLQHVNPVAALFVETELWANTLYHLKRLDIPAILVNGRLSETSFNRYYKHFGLSVGMMKNLSLILAQDGNSAKRFRKLGAESSKIRLTGSLKWVANTQQSNANATKQTDDEQLSELSELQQAIGARFVWVAASTHAGEEATMLAVQKRLLENNQAKHSSFQHPPLLILVPRHPERFDEVASLFDATTAKDAAIDVASTFAELNMVRRSQQQLPDTHCQVYLADSMGEMPLWYQLAQVAFVGGSVVDIGGHNPIEAYQHQTPVVMGQYTDTCQTLVDELLAVNAMMQIHTSDATTPVNQSTQPLSKQQPDKQDGKQNKTIDPQAQQQVIDQLYQALYEWQKQPALLIEMGKQGYALIDKHKHVLQRQFELIQRVLGTSSDDVQDANLKNVELPDTELQDSKPKDAETQEL